VRVAVDLLPMGSGGQHGGIKPHVYGFLASIASRRPRPLHFDYLVNSAAAGEVREFARNGDRLIVATRAEEVPTPSEELQATVPLLVRPLSEGMHRELGWRASYCPFGYSPLLDSPIPAVCLLVDTLHRDLPSALPPEEVVHREQRMADVVARARRIQCSTEFVIGRLNALYGTPRERCFRAYVAVHGRLPEPRPDRVRPDRPYFLYPANFWPHKNHERLLLAYQAYRERTGDGAWDLWLTGYPDARGVRLTEFAQDLGLATSVCFLGHVGPGRLADLWADTGALIFPSRYEGFGIPLIEAMRFGAPILASRAASIPEVAGDAALYADPESLEELVAGMLKIAGDRELRARLQASGSRRLDAFSLEVEADRLAEVLHQVATGRTT
jgi:glycosyltransferase involved in cell wall biosynthesis